MSTFRDKEDHTVVVAAQSPNDQHWINKDIYRNMYARSISDPESFWTEQAEEHIDWIEKWSQVKDTKFSKNDVKIHWFKDAKLNVCYNCVDRHLATRANQTAFIWEGDNPEESEHITYQQLHSEVCRFANVLKELGVKKGDVVTIYMPMIPEAAYAMLACARIGAVHSVVFGGFSPDALHGRIEDCNSKLVITADEGIRGGKKIPLLDNVRKALERHSAGSKATAQNPENKSGSCANDTVIPQDDIKTLIISASNTPQTQTKSEYLYQDLHSKVSDQCDIEVMDSEDPLFVLYTSGSTGKPKGVVHSSGGYILYTAMTHKYVFDYQEGDVYWCTADVGWVTGHSYIVYGPLANGATSLIFEGTPTYPFPSRFWEVVDKHQVTQFYTAPTAIRALMALGDRPVQKTSRKSLRILGSVGEPINPEAWQWYYNIVGDARCPIVDTWWQTETGGFLITPFPYATDLKPGSATLPFFGIQPVIVDAQTGERLEGECEGALCIADSWPGQMRTVLGDHDRFIQTYFSQYDGHYFSGDGCRRDADGYYWITGRIDDVLNISGHRIGTAEVESSLVEHHDVAEAAVVGYPHDIKGQGMYVYVTLNEGIVFDQALHDELVAKVRSDIGAFAKPDHLQFTPGLPKTRSGKIMRRILRKIAENDFSNLGDTSTLLDPEIVETLISQRLNR